jgi:hypothetical protein
MDETFFFDFSIKINISVQTQAQDRESALLHAYEIAKLYIEHLDKSTDIRVEKDTVSITENDVVSPENETI